MRANRYDVWMANLGPSEDLRKAWGTNRITWAEFGRRYRKELKEALNLKLAILFQLPQMEAYM